MTKQEQFDKMLEAAISFAHENKTEVSCLLVAVTACENDQVKHHVSATGQDNNTVHHFGHAVHEISEFDERMFDEVMSAIACATLSEGGLGELLAILTNAKGTMH